MVIDNTLSCCFSSGKWKSNDKSSSLSQKRAGFGTRVFGSNTSQPEKSTRLPDVSFNTSRIATSTFLRPSQSEDNTGELSELYQLLSSREVVRLGQSVSYLPTLSKAVPRQLDLETMLAELAGSNNWSLSPSVSLTSSSAWTTRMSSAVAGEKGRRYLDFCEYHRCSSVSRFLTPSSNFGIFSLNLDFSLIRVADKGRVT